MTVLIALALLLATAAALVAHGGDGSPKACSWRPYSLGKLIEWKQYRTPEVLKLNTEFYTEAHKCLW